MTSEQVLVWAKRVEAKRAQSAIITSLSETKEFDKIKTIKVGQTQSEKATNVPKCLQTKAAVIVVPAIHPYNAQPMGRSVWSVARLITFGRSAEVEK